MERRLGRGLGSLLSSSASPQPSEDATGELAIDKIEANPFQPRQHFDPEALEELRASLDRHGLLQPIVVRSLEGADSEGRFQLVSGERRLRAAQLAGWERITAVVRPNVSDHELLELALIENVQRKDLDPIERARSFHRMGEELGLTQEAIAERVSLKRSTVANHIRLLELPEEVQTALEKDMIGMGHARALLGLKSAKAQVALLADIVRKDLSVREVERRVRSARAPRDVPQPPSARPAWVAPLEARMRDALGTKVALEGGSDRGRIVIQYFRREDLDRLLEQLAPRQTL